VVVDALLHIGLGNAVVAPVLALAAWCAGRVCRRPALVHSLWLLVLLKLVTPPLVPFPILQAAAPDAQEVDVQDPPAFSRHVEVLPADELRAGPAERRGKDSSIDRRPTPRPYRAARKTPEHVVASSPPEVTAVTWQGVVVAVWLAGCVAWWAVAAYRIRLFQRLVRDAVPAEPALQERARNLARRLGMARSPAVSQVPAPIPPLLWAALGRALILLPTTLWTRCTSEQQDALLAHELAHLRRRDHWVRLLELMAGGLYWWHPVVWWARHELREAEEQCCDAWVVWALPASAPAYAAAIVNTVSFLSQAQRTPPLPASGVGHVHNLKRRLTMIVRGTPPRSLSVPGFLGVVALAAALLPLLPTWAQTADDEKPKNRPVVTKTEKPAKLDALPAAEKPKSTRGAAGDAAPDPKSGPRVAGDSVPAPKAAPRDKNFARDAGKLAAEPKSAPAKTKAEQLESAQEEVELLEVQLEAKKAGVEEAMAQMKQATKEVMRYRALLERNVTSADIVDEKEANRASTQARLRGKQAVMAEAAIRLKHARRRLASLQPRPKAEDSRGAEPLNKKRRLEDLEKKLDALEKVLESIRREIRPKKGNTNRAK
jgi:beta-lactamase regulating signal transducer with metallopeptidase domain